MFTMSFSLIGSASFTQRDVQVKRLRRYNQKTVKLSSLVLWLVHYIGDNCRNKKLSNDQEKNIFKTPFLTPMSAVFNEAGRVGKYIFGGLYVSFLSASTSISFHTSLLDGLTKKEVPLTLTYKNTFIGINLKTKNTGNLGLDHNYENCKNRYLRQETISRVKFNN